MRERLVIARRQEPQPQRLVRVPGAVPLRVAHDPVASAAEVPHPAVVAHVPAQEVGHLVLGEELVCGARHVDVVELLRHPGRFGGEQWRILEQHTGDPVRRAGGHPRGDQPAGGVSGQQHGATDDAVDQIDDVVADRVDPIATRRPGGFTVTGDIDHLYPEVAGQRR